MTSDLDIYRTANVLIREHGEDSAHQHTSAAAKMLGNPHLTPHYFRQMPSNIREELDSFRASLPERDRAALNRRLLLS